MRRTFIQHPLPHIQCVIIWSRSHWRLLHAIALQLPIQRFVSVCFFFVSCVRSRNVAILSGTFFLPQKHVGISLYCGIALQWACVCMVLVVPFKEIPCIDKNRFCNEWSINNNWKIFIYSTLDLCKRNDNEWKTKRNIDKVAPYLHTVGSNSVRFNEWAGNIGQACLLVGSPLPISHAFHTQRHTCGYVEDKRVAEYKLHCGASVSAQLCNCPRSPQMSKF